MSEHERGERESEEIRPTPEAPDPSGTYANQPGRTGEHPDGDRPADETVPPGDA